MTTLLVVDDESALRTVIAEVLRDEGYTVVTADGGRAAVAAFAREAPDLVLMDVMMPDMDGREAYLAMRAQAHGRPVPIVLMSAAVARARTDPGVSGFLPKPFDVEQLLGLVARLLGGGADGNEATA